MSAILGRIEYGDQGLEKSQFERAFNALSDYGGDGTAIVCGKNYAFGLHYFCTKPNGRKQISLEGNGCTLVADAILDARAELLSNLGLPFSEAEALSDLELIRRAYLKWGHASPDKLFGDYSFSAYNPETQELFLARDHIGKRPLYWTRTNDSFTFSTDIAALLGFDDTERKIDQKILLRHMQRGPRPQAKTLFEGINFVDPGCHMIVSRTGQKQTRWWNPHDIKTVHGRSAKTCIRELKHLLEQVVEDNVDTDLPLGAHMSGGIDSGTVTALSAKALKSKGRSLVSAYAWAPDFSEDFPDQGKTDERHNIKRICDSSGISVRFGNTDYRTLEAFHQRKFEKEGFADLSEEPSVLAQASKDGVRTILSGWGGDEAFSTIGNDYLPYCLKRLKFVEAYRVLRFMCGGRRKPQILTRVLYHYGLLPLLPEWLYRRLMHNSFDEDPTSFINPSFLKSDPDLKTWCSQDLMLTSDPKTYLANLQLYGHLAARADTWANWSSKYCIQYRYPLLDRRIMEFILGVPNELLFADGKPRFLARHATKDLLPENLMKNDSANEQLRWKLRFDYWKALAEYEKDGAFKDESQWLDMPSVRDAIKRCPDKLTKDGKLTFRRLSLSIRVWYLARRHGSSSTAGDIS